MIFRIGVVNKSQNGIDWVRPEFHSWGVKGTDLGFYAQGARLGSRLIWRHDPPHVTRTFVDGK